MRNQSDFEDGETALRPDLQKLCLGGVFAVLGLCRRLRRLGPGGPISRPPQVNKGSMTIGSAEGRGFLFLLVADVVFLVHLTVLRPGCRLCGLGLAQQRA